MDLNDIHTIISKTPNTDNNDKRVATLFHNLGFEFKGSGKKITSLNDQIIGEIDLIFQDKNDDILIIIEVSKKKDKGVKEKIDHFLSRWQDEKNISRLKNQLKLIPSNIFRFYFDFSELGIDYSNKASLSHVITENDKIFNIQDLIYFEQTFKTINKWAKNDLYNFIDYKSNLGYEDIPAIAYKIGDFKAYVYADKVSNILRYSYVFRRKEKEKGYQRMIQEGRIGSISKAIKIKKTITFPNSIMLNANTTLSTENIESFDKPQVVKIKIPKAYCQFRVIDGQHRLLGFAKMGEFNLNNYSLPIVILENLDLNKEIKTFIEINNKQKKLDSNLILSLKADFDWDINDEEFFEKICVLIAKELNINSELKGNIFFGYADEKKGNKVTITTLASAIIKNKFVGNKMHLFQDDIKDYKHPFNKIKEILATIAKIFKSHKTFFFTSKGIRILFRYVQIYQRNFDKKNINISFEDNIKDLKKVFPDDLLISRTSKRTTL